MTDAAAMPDSSTPQSGGGPLEIRELETAGRASWDAYVDAHPEGTFFQLSGWREVLAASTGFKAYYLTAWRDGRIAGVLPLARVRSWLFGDALVSQPFCVHAGPIADDETTQAALIAHAAALAARLRVGCLELRNTRRMVPEWACKDDLYVVFRRAILPDEDANMKAIPRKQRAMVRKGMSAGLVSREERELADFFRIYATSVRNLGTPVFPRRYFAALLREFGDRVRITTVFEGAEPVSAVMSFVYKDAVMPYYGGGTPRARDVKAYDFMYWEVMRKACAEGLRVFDYGRSKRDSGSYDFKKNWGFEPTPLAYEYYLVKDEALPNLNPNNPKFSLAVATWKHLPLPLANAIGPWISPYLA